MIKWESIIILARLFLENAIHCSINHDRFAAEVHQKGMISINNIQIENNAILALEISL